MHRFSPRPWQGEWEAFMIIAGSPFRVTADSKEFLRTDVARDRRSKATSMPFPPATPKATWVAPGGARARHGSLIEPLPRPSTQSSSAPSSCFRHNGSWRSLESIRLRGALSSIPAIRQNRNSR